MLATEPIQVKGDPAAVEPLLAQGPMSLLVEERLQFTMYSGNPSTFGDAPDVYLAMSWDSTRTAVPLLVHPTHVDRMCGELDDAARRATT